MRLRKLPSLIAGFCLVMFGFLPAMAQANNQGSSTGHDAESKPASAQNEIPPCAPAPTEVPGKKSESSHRPHSVTLTWKPSTARSKSGKDEIVGYYIYRSQKSHKYGVGDRLNSVPIAGTSCIDKTVAARATYFYTIMSVTQGGEQSVLSDEVKAVVPSP